MAAVCNGQVLQDNLASAPVNQAYTVVDVTSVSRENGDFQHHPLDIASVILYTINNVYLCPFVSMK